MSYRHTFTKSLLSRIVLWRSPRRSYRHYSQIEGLLKWHSALGLESALYREKPPSQRSWAVLAVRACLTTRVAVTPVEGVCQQLRIMAAACCGAKSSMLITPLWELLSWWLGAVSSTLLQGTILCWFCSLQRSQWWKEAPILQKEQF